MVRTGGTCQEVHVGVGLDLITFRGLVYENVFDEDKQLSRRDGRSCS